MTVAPEVWLVYEEEYEKLFESQSFDRVQPGSFLSRIIPEEDTYYTGEKEGDEYYQWLDMGKDSKEIIKPPGDQEGKPYTHHPAYETEHDSFDQELNKYISASRSNRTPYTDLSRSLGNSNKHDIHYTYTTNEK